MFWIAYTRLIYWYGLIIRLATIWSPKAQQWIKGRSEQVLPELDRPIWFHVASLGEFEQARPLIELIRRKYPNSSILLSFFSPSGYLIRQDYEKADEVIYLPLDTPKSAAKLIDLYMPRALIFTKYDLWYNLIRKAQGFNIPCYLISATFTPHSLPLRWFASPMKRTLLRFSGIFCQDQRTYDLLNRHKFNNIHLSGDTRVDRVLEIQNETFHLPNHVNAFIGDAKIFIIGSSWAKDESILWPVLKRELPEDWKIILAPHEVSPDNIKRIRASSPFSTVLISDNNLDRKATLLIVDSIGILNKLYAFAKIAYIGGGFGKGIHNTLEPAAAKLPVIFGPKHTKFNEAKEMLAIGTGFAVNHSQDLSECLSSLWNENTLEQIAQKQAEFLAQNSGASDDVLALLEKQAIFK